MKELASLIESVERAVHELDEWERSEDARTYTDRYRSSIRASLERALNVNSIDELAARVQLLFRQITDSGPLSADFLPSLQALGQALEKRAQRTAGCGRCQNLVIDYRIQTPGEFRKALRVVRANLDDRTIVLLGSEESERAFDLTEAGPWPDFIEHEFQCSSCGQVFRLGVETYHGAGGEWAPVA